MAAFAPLLFVAGTMGKVMRQIPIVVIAVLLMSLVEALLHPAGPPVGDRTSLLRAVSRGLGRWARSSGSRRGCSGPRSGSIKGPTAQPSSVALEWRYLTVALALIVLILVHVGLVAGGLIKFSLMPKVDADNMVAYLTMPQGTPVEQTEAVLARHRGGGRAGGGGVRRRAGRRAARR